MSKTSQWKWHANPLRQTFEGFLQQWVMPYSKVFSIMLLLVSMFINDPKRLSTDSQVMSSRKDTKLLTKTVGIQKTLKT